MKKTVFIIILMFLGVTAYAQNNDARRSDDAPRRGRTMRKAFSPEEMAKMEADAINAAVGLDSLQYQLVYILKYSDMVAMQDSMKARAARAPKKRGTDAPPRLDDKQREEWMKAREDVMKKRREAMNEQMKQILTPKQYKKYLKYEEDKYSRRHKQGERRSRRAEKKQ